MESTHLAGRYSLASHLISGTLCFLGGVLGVRYMTANPSSADARSAPLPSGSSTLKLVLPGAPSPKEKTGPKENPPLGKRVRGSDPSLKRAVPEPTDITMAAYFRLLADDEVPQYDVARQYIGRKVRWKGFFRSLDVYPERTDIRHRVCLTSHQDGGYREYCYIRLPVGKDRNLSKLKKGIPVVVTGVLTGRTTLEDARIESVGK